MFSLKFANAQGSIIDLTGNENFDVTNITGLNPPQANINTSTSPNFDGTIYNSATVEQRNIVIYLSLSRNVEQTRLNLYKFFRTKQKGTLYYKSNLRDVWIDGYINNIEVNNFENPVTMQISMICPQPYFIDMDEIIAEIAEIINKLEFALDLPEAGIEFGQISPYIEVNVVNNGEIETGTTFELRATGDVVNPKIYNKDTNEFFGLNFTMQLGDVITITTSKGNKTVTLNRQGTISNLFNYISENSTWLTLKTGDNVFLYTTYENEDGTDTNENLYIRILHADQYEGV